MMTNKDFNLQEALKAHTEWLAWELWNAEDEDEEVRGEEPPQGKQFVTGGADLVDADLVDADLRRANLRDAHLSDADLIGANLSDANLSDADFRRANLSGADLSGANLRRANLSGADLVDANLSGANLRECVGNSKEIKSMQTDTYRFAWTNATLAIGCQQHPLKDWLEFSDKKKASFAPDGLEYLNKWLPILDSMGVFDPVKEDCKSD